MLEFPIILFFDGGENIRRGGTYREKVVTNQEQYDDAISKGAATHPDFIGKIKPVEIRYNTESKEGRSKIDVIDFDKITTKELRKLAANMGIRFDGRTADRTIIRLIKEHHELDKAADN